MYASTSRSSRSRTTLRAGGGGLALLLISTAVLADTLELSPAAVASRGPLAPSVITVVASDYEFDAPDTTPVGMITLRLVNYGVVPHHARVVRLDGGRTLRDLERELFETGLLPSWAADVGGPGVTAPGGVSEVTLELAPGRHVLLGAAGLAGGANALMKGMYRDFVAVPTGARAAAPLADAVLTLEESRLRVDGRLSVGRQLVLARNRSGATHELRIYRLETGRTPADLHRWLRTEEGRPPAAIVGGVAALATGAESVLTLDIAAGEHVLLCLAPELRAAPPHRLHGLLHRLRVAPRGGDEGRAARPR